MKSKYCNKLKEDEIVIIATKENPELFLPARIFHTIESKFIGKNYSDSTQYEYNVQTVNYEENPFDNFPMTDNTFLSWDDLSYFETIKNFKGNTLYYVNEYLK